MNEWMNEWMKALTNWATKTSGELEPFTRLLCDTCQDLARDTYQDVASVRR